MTPRQRWAMLAGGVATTTAVGLVVFAGNQILANAERTRVAVEARGSEERGQSSELVEFRDEEAGFAVSYPSDWTRISDPGDPQVHLLMALNERDSHSFSVRVVPLRGQVQPNDVPALTNLTNSLVNASEGVKLLDGPRQIEIDGLPGLIYFYNFTDSDGELGAHSHYFLFKDDKIISMVFQALPEDGFRQLAPTFDRIANSFRVLPKPTTADAPPATADAPPATADAPPAASTPPADQ